MLQKTLENGYTEHLQQHIPYFTFCANMMIEKIWGLVE